MTVKHVLAVAVPFLLCSLLCAQKQSGGKGVDLESEMPADAHHLKIGDAAPDFSLKGVDGKIYTLANFKDSPILMVAFLSNHCPYSHAAETRLLPMAAEMKSRGVATVAINPNAPDAVDIGEMGYSKYGDSYDEMKLYAKERNFPFPYLYDGDTQKTAKAYGCLCTPHVFIFDKDRKLRYMGRVDDSKFADLASVKSPDARNALEALLAGKAVPVEVTKPFGCSTKWVEHKADIAKVDQAWDAAPVEMDTIDLAGVSKLVANKTNKVRLINVWATWCVPCVEEFPNLVQISRQFANRDFEVITLSADDPKDQAKVQAFLTKEHASIPNRVQRSLKVEGRKTNNYLYSGTDMDALMKAIDPEAPGPLPYTIVIAPGGKVLYRHVNAFGLSEMEATLVQVLGAYYPDPVVRPAVAPATAPAGH